MVTGIIVLTLLVFLATRELAGGGDSGFPVRIAGFLSVPIASLLILFVLLLSLAMAEILLT